VGAASKPIEVQRTPTRSSDGTPFERMCAAIQAIWPKDEDVQTIAVASPGPLDPQSGVVFSAPNIAGWDNFPLRSELHKKSGSRS